MKNERAIFAGGCFWCIVKPFDQQPGFISVTSGYTGGHTLQPTYDEVCRGKTGHTEAVEIVFDPEIISYPELVEIYWRQTDPTDAFGQFQDRGDSYRPVIYYTTDEQRKSAVASKEKLEKSGKYTEPIVTSIEAAPVFYPAESYHQGYYLRHPERYESESQERQAFTKKQWGEKG